MTQIELLRLNTILNNMEKEVKEIRRFLRAVEGPPPILDGICTIEQGIVISEKVIEDLL